MPGNMCRKSTFYLPVLVVMILVGCSSSREVIREAETTGGEQYEITHEIEPDVELASFIEPYVSPIRDHMNQVLTISEGTFSRDQPEGTLGNLTADILRSRAAYEMRTRVHIAIMNNGGLRIPLPEGEVTVGHIFELMPFDNYITLLKFTGNQILSIADELAAVGGEPVSGMRMRIQDGKARDVLVGARTVEPEMHYWVATNNWMADGGGDMPTLWEPLQRVDHELLIRDAFIYYLGSKEAIQPEMDNRLR